MRGHWISAFVGMPGSGSVAAEKSSRSTDCTVEGLP